MKRMRGNGGVTDGGNDNDGTVAVAVDRGGRMAVANDDDGDPLRVPSVRILHTYKQLCVKYM